MINTRRDIPHQQAAVLHFYDALVGVLGSERGDRRADDPGL